MSYEITLCEQCHERIASELHHRFSQTKMNKKVYPEYIHNAKNLIKVCEQCHKNKGVPKISEIEFCKLMGISPRTTDGKVAWNRMYGVDITGGEIWA